MRRRRISADSADSGSGDHHAKRKDSITPLTAISETTSNRSVCASSAMTTSATLTSPKVSNGKRNDQIDKGHSIGTNDSKETNNKRHKKRRKHHHCKHKLQKPNNKQKSGSKQTPGEEAEDEESVDDDSEDENDQNLRIKLDGSFNNTTTYSIRSPIYPAGKRACSEGGSNHEDEKERDGDDEFDGDDEENEEEGDEEDESESSDEEDTRQKSPRKHVSYFFLGDQLII